MVEKKKKILRIKSVKKTKQQSKDDHAAIGIITIKGFKLLIVVQKDAQTHRSIAYKNSLYKKFFLLFLHCI
jgi:hypothetical protein